MPAQSGVALCRGENTIEARVTIQRPVQKVFGFYRDFKNLPRFLGDVMAIEQSGPATSRWTIQGPLGIRIKWTIRVTEERTNELIRYETVTSPGLRTYWEVHFAPGSEGADGSSRSDESPSRKTRTGGTRSHWKIPGARGVFQSAQIEAGDGNGKGDRHKLFRSR